MKTFLDLLCRAPEDGTGAEAPPPQQEPTGSVTTDKADPPPQPDGDDKAEGEEPSDEAAEAPAPLSRDDIEVPEGFEVDEEQFNQFLELVNNPELDPKDRTNQLVALHTNLVKGMQEKMASDWIERQQADAKAIKDDPEIGAANFEASQTAFANVLGEFGDEKLLEDLVASGLGNKLSFAKFLVNVNKVMSEGKPVVGDPTSDKELTAAEKLYPTHGKG